MPKKVLLTISDDESETYLSAVDQKKTAYVSGAGSSSDSDSGDDSARTDQSFTIPRMFVFLTNLFTMNRSLVQYVWKI